MDHNNTAEQLAAVAEATGIKGIKLIYPLLIMIAGIVVGEATPVNDSHFPGWIMDTAELASRIVATCAGVATVAVALRNLKKKKHGNN